MLSHVEKVAKELNISPHLLNDAYRDLLIQIKRTIAKDEMPKVLINGFGTFYTDLTKIEYNIRREIKKYKIGRISRDLLKRRLERLFPVRRRLKYERQEAEKRKVSKKSLQREQSKQRRQMALDKGKTGRVNATRNRRTSRSTIRKEGMEKGAEALESLRKRKEGL